MNSSSPDSTLETAFIKMSIPIENELGPHEPEEDEVEFELDEEPFQEKDVKFETKCGNSSSDIRQSQQEIKGEVCPPVKNEREVYEVYEEDSSVKEETEHCPRERALSEMYESLYRRKGKLSFALNCGSDYQSGRGMYYHLNNTSCGYGQKNAKLGSRSLDYTNMWGRVGNSYVCCKCEVTYHSPLPNNGILNKYAIHAYTHGLVTGSGLSHTSVV